MFYVQSLELSTWNLRSDLFLATPVDSAPEGPGALLLVLHARDAPEIEPTREEDWGKKAHGCEGSQSVFINVAQV